MPARARVLLADDHVLLLEAFRRMLEPEVEIVGACADGAALVEQAIALEPDLVVADVSMPRMNGLEAARRLRGELPGTRVVFLTVNEDPQMAAEAFALGASGYLLKSSTATELHQAIRAVLAGRAICRSGWREGIPTCCRPPRSPTARSSSSRCASATCSSCWPKA